MRKNVADIFSSVLKLFLAVTVLISCESEPKYQACKCEGELVTFENYVGIVAFTRSNEYIIISDQLGFVSACAGLSDELKVDGQKVVFAGRYIKNCQTSLPDYGVKNMNVQVTSIAKSDTIFTNGSLIIEILNSKDYGYIDGFGYYINFNNSFKIRQPDIPGLGNNKTFKTSNDAYKIAVRVGYRLNTSKDFPSTPYTDLYYLKIVD